MEMSQFVIRLCAVGLVFLQAVTALGQNATIAFTSSSNSSLLLASRSSHVGLLLDGGDWPGVLRAAHDVAVDFGRVTGLNGSVTVSGNSTLKASTIFNVTGISKDWSVGEKSNRTAAGTIIAGTIGKSSLIDALIKNSKLDASKVEGQWEAYISVVVDNPTKDIVQALVIAGSDKRGTIFGLYDVSEQIGVSPWYWWADVSPKSHDQIYALKTTKIQKSPTVKYRGIFINDEAPALTGWANEKYPRSKWNSPFNADFYSHVFELLLRSRANYLWPAMWGSMFGVDDVRNQPLADEYGIVMGSSHTEPLVRSTKEWQVFGKGAWQWTENKDNITVFMKEGAERAKNFENVVTVGMRGSHDTAMSPDVQTEVLQDVVDTQQKILDEVFGDAKKVPQMWCLYKEVQDYFEAGMKVPDHVTLLWTEDNWGNIRRLPVGNETQRSGGAGVYYHFDYVGDPRNYKWINNEELQKTREQMYQAVVRNATEIWVVNVGDIKPVEIPISHFLDMAYDIDAWKDVDSVPRWLEGWAGRQWESSLAEEIGTLIDEYGRLAAIRKFELIEPSSFSILSYEEADQIMARWKDLGERAQTLYVQLPEAQQASFFETVLHPVLAGGNMVDIQVSSARNQIYAGQGRNTANTWMQRVLEKMKVDHELTVRFHELLGGKWNHMMDQTHTNYKGYWQQPMRQISPALNYVMHFERSLSGDMGVAVERSNASVPGDDIYHDNGGGSLKLPTTNPYSPKRWLEIFHQGTQSFDWKISGPSYVNLTQSSGSMNTSSPDVRVYVDVDWSAAPAGSSNAVLNITSSRDYGTQFSMPTVQLPIENVKVPSSFTSGFVESNRELAFEAEHFTRLTPKGSLTYDILPLYGRTLSSLTLNDPLAPSLTSATAPLLEYDFYTFSNTTASKGLNVTLILSPTLNTTPKRPLAYITQLDDKPEQRRQYVIDQPQPNFPVNWGYAVANAAWYNTTSWGATQPGKHTLKVWLVEPGVVLQKIVLDLGGVAPSYLGPPESFRVSGENGTAAHERRVRRN